MYSWLIVHLAAPCSGGGFLGFPAWYKYLDGKTVTDANGVTSCAPVITGLTDVWLIVAAVIEILLQLAAIVAVIFVIVGGVQFITSQGSPDATTKARNTIINAIIGLFITIVAATVVSFIAGSVH